MATCEPLMVFHHCLFPKPEYNFYIPMTLCNCITHLTGVGSTHLWVHTHVPQGLVMSQQGPVVQSVKSSIIITIQNREWLLCYFTPTLKKIGLLTISTSPAPWIFWLSASTTPSFSSSPLALPPPPD